MTHSCVQCDSCTCATWLIYICSMSHAHVRHDSCTGARYVSFICVTFCVCLCPSCVCVCVCVRVRVCGGGRHQQTLGTHNKIELVKQYSWEAWHAAPTTTFYQAAACAMRRVFGCQPDFIHDGGAYIHIYMHAHIRACMSSGTYIHTYIHAHKHACVTSGTYIHTYVHAYKNMHVWLQVRTYIHTYMHIKTCMCDLRYVHTCIQTCMHIYMHKWDH